MLTIQYLRENAEEAAKRLEVRNSGFTGLINKVIKLDDERKSIQNQLDNTLAESKKISKTIGTLMGQGKTEEAENAKARTAELKQKSKELNQQLTDITNEIEDILPEIPNVPHESVPAGEEEDDNIEISGGGTSPEFKQKALPHWELAHKYNLIDFELGNKITGSGFPVYVDKGAKIQRALINYFLQRGEEEGYKEVQPPVLVNKDSAFATGQLPDKEGQMYKIESDGLYPIPTAEVPVTNMYRDNILNAKDLPIKKMAYTPCFRREAGSYGKNVRGLNRVHQFDKVEIVQIEHPERSWDTLETMVKYVEKLIKQLGLPYRIMRLCGGDLGFAASMTYDFEVYAAAQDKWLEVSSVSNFTSYQANRLKLKFKEEDSKKAKLAHTLNGSALALPRLLAALLENYQTEDGIIVPEVLQPFTGFDKIT